MSARGITQILNVTDLEESFRWFEAFGWARLWDWGDPPGFGAVGSGPVEIFLCQGGQGGRSRLPDGQRSTDSEEAEGNRGVWMSLWVADVDVVHARCLDADIEVLAPPEDMPWRVREMWVRHPDGHVFRVGRGLDYEEPSTVRTPPLPIERVDVPVRLERRLVAVLKDLADHKGMTLAECLEETLLHSFEPAGGGVASPHVPEDFDVIESLKERHGLDYDTHATYRFVEDSSQD
jgi:catechol 2,3-dioxygenase-like lactoylglutathione lyase family enzyme